VNDYLIPGFGSVQLGKLSPTAIQKVYSEWATGGRKDGREGGLAPQTIRHLHRVLRASLARACELQILGRNVADAFRKRLPKIERKEMLTLTPDQSARLLEALRHSRVYWPVLLALSTGMRRGEIMALRWSNVDPDRGIVTVTESLEETKTGLRFKAPKNEKHRSVALPAYAVDELRRHWTEQAQELLRLGVQLSGKTLVCAREDGEPKRPLALTYEFARFVKRFPWLPRGLRFHDLRHSHATQLLASGVHPKIAQERLGHSSISVTLDLYSHVSPTMQSDAAERLDLAMRGALAGLKKGVP
jgi:integrase